MQCDENIFELEKMLKEKKMMSKFDIRINKKYYIYNVNHYAKLNNIEIQCLNFEEDTPVIAKMKHIIITDPLAVVELFNAYRDQLDGSDNWF